MSDGKLSPEILLSAVQSLGKHCKSLHRTETTGTSALQRGAEPLQGHTWLPARSQGEPKLPLDTGLAPWLLPWFLPAFAHLPDLSLLS